MAVCSIASDDDDDNCCMKSVSGSRLIKPDELHWRPSNL